MAGLGDALAKIGVGFEGLVELFSFLVILALGSFLIVAVALGAMDELRSRRTGIARQPITFGDALWLVAAIGLGGWLIYLAIFGRY